MDGIVAASLVENFAHISIANNYFPCDYSKEFNFDQVQPGDTVYIVDLSLTPEKLERVIELTRVKKVKVVWIDHHRTSSDALIGKGLTDSLSGISGLVITDTLIKVNGSIRYEHSGFGLPPLCGAALTWLYFHDYHNPGSIIELGSAIMYAIPRYIQLVNDYDTWQVKEDGVTFMLDPDTTYFKCGFDSIEAPYPPLSNELHDLFNDHQTNHSAIIDLLDRGKLLRTHIMRGHRSYFERFAYESSFEGYTAITVNSKSNSWIVGRTYPLYQLVIVYAFDGSQYECSIFSIDKSIDCSAIAKKYGGGGHRGAAGFIVDELPFKPMGKPRYDFNGMPVSGR